MRSVFMGADFYRIGGDDFVIICPGMEKDVFHSKLRELKAQFQNDPHYQAAIGSQWTHKVENRSQIIANADAEMYEDKKEFYRTHPCL